MKLIQNYENAVEDIAKEICKIFKYNYNRADWTGCEIGDVFSIGDMFINTEEMITMLKMNATRQEYVAYYDAVTEGKKINLKNWLVMTRSGMK